MKKRIAPQICPYIEPQKPWTERRLLLIEEFRRRGSIIRPRPASYNWPAAKRHSDDIERLIAEGVLYTKRTSYARKGRSAGRGYTFVYLSDAFKSPEPPLPSPGPYAKRKAALKELKELNAVA